ncbi:MAG: stage III sporulation protein D, partial [Oscillospiraceae bacterium]|nr:stage III sporulation protein D [Oscillospiraceae bacterium]
MKGQPNDRAIILGQYILDNNATVRATAKKFGISKSTVHKDVTD